jgi:hypothetical protein
MKPSVLLKVSFLLLFFALEIFSLPRFSMKFKDKCADCHVNPTGGMMRNENGFYFGKNVIGLISPREKDFPLSPKLTNNVSFGLDYRTQFIYSQEKKRTDFQDMTGSIYLNAGLSEKIDVVARYDFVQSIWEGYGVAKILPNNSYIKVGSFIPYYGIRLDDHTAYTRGGDFGLLFSTGNIQGMIYNPFYLETGIELGANISNFAMLTASVGKSKFNSTLTSDPAITTRLEINPTLEDLNFLLGGSFASVKTRNLGGIFNTSFYGGFAGIGTKYFSLLGEYDIAKDYLALNTKSSALMLEASYQLMVGLEAVVRFDRFDPNIDFEKDELSRVVFGFEFFPFSFVELRPQYRIQLEEPSKENNSFVLQFHFWY